MEFVEVRLCDVDRNTINEFLRIMQAIEKHLDRLAGDDF